MNAEDDFRVWAESEGWAVTKKGWPDFLCRRNGAVIAVEVKAGNDTVRIEQDQALRDLNALGMPTYLWTRESGLRPYAAKAPKQDTNALLLEIDDLHAALRTVIAERDRLTSELADHRNLARPPVHPYREKPTVAEQRKLDEDREARIAKREAEIRARLSPERYARLLRNRQQRDPIQIIARRGELDRA